MPELPEVETIRRDLAAHLVGRRFVGVELYWAGAVKHPSPEELPKRLVGRRIVALDRRGKYLLLHLDEGCLIFHLMMSGALLLRPAQASWERFTRNVFFLDDALELRFVDPRKLGRIWLVKDENEIVGKLGPEPLVTSFSKEVLTKRLSSRKAPIKPLLLDQELVAGLGNIYADEALFVAGIHPLRPAQSLSSREMQQLYNGIVRVLRQGVENRGTTLSDYQDAHGRAGNNREALQVFRRRGQPCPRCGTALERIVVRGRGTHYCPRCQTL